MDNTLDYDGIRVVDYNSNKKPAKGLVRFPASLAFGRASGLGNLTTKGQTQKIICLKTFTFAMISSSPQKLMSVGHSSIKDIMDVSAKKR